ASTGSAKEPADEAKVPVPLVGLGTAAARGEAALALQTLGLKPGDAVSYRVRVADNRPPELGGANEAFTAPRELRIVEQAEPLYARRRSAEDQEFRARIEAIQRAAAENRQQTEQLRYAADAALRGNGSWDAARGQALAQSEGRAGEVADELHKLARDFEP